MLISLKANPDYDYHLVVQDLQGRTMIVESADPRCMQTVSSPFRPQMTLARRAIDAAFSVNAAGQSPDVPITITGIGFFDYAYFGSYGEAPNGIELHPLLSFCTGQDCSAGV
ncbi:MAG: hypothetical protein M3T49_04835 [Candidatus Eremiobacteraeota bacterium]|nr:hypothetical protein [Candidatus Eremiobacteraeota bacterium]